MKKLRDKIPPRLLTILTKLLDVVNSRWTYVLFGLVSGVMGVVVVFFFDPSKVTYKESVEGIAVFAVLYVLAQGVERIVEFVTDLLKLIPESPGAVRTESIRELRKANSTLNGNPTPEAFGAASTEKATAEKKADKARTGIVFLSHGLSILLAAIAVNWLNYGMMDSLGAQDLNEDLDRFLTALAAAGGSKGLHELIGRVQAAKEKTQTTS